MFRQFLRDALTAGVLLVVLGAAAAVLGLPEIASAHEAPWSREVVRVSAHPMFLARDAALLLFALAALGGILRLIVSGLLLLGPGYPAMAHLAEILAGGLARRIGAIAGVLLAVLQGGTARAAGSPSPASPALVATTPTTLSMPRARPTLLPTGPHTPPSDSTAHRDTARQRHTVKRPGAGPTRRPVRHVGMALRYTVQSGDTMDDVAARFGLPDWRPIMRATRGLHQPIGGTITDPDLILPGQILLMPLPCPALRMSGDHVLYVIQRDDYLSEIAARFLGDWRAYRTIADLNRSVHQPDGGTLQNDNLIQPGWVLRIPQEYVVTQPGGARAVHRVVVAYTHPVRLRHGLRPRPPLPRPVPTPMNPVPKPLHPGRHSRPQNHGSPAAGIHRPAIVASPAHKRLRPREHGGIRLRPRPHHHVTRPHPQPMPLLPPHPIRRPLPLYPERHASHAVHRPAGRSARQGRLVPRRGAPAVPRPVVPLRPRPVYRPGPHRPLVHVPDLGRDFPVAFLLGFLALAAAVATARRRGRHSGQKKANIARWAGRLATLAPSARRALRTALSGAEGRFARALRRTSVESSGGARAAHVLETLDRVGREAGVSHSLAEATRLLLEGAETVQVVAEIPRLSAGQVDDVVSRLGTALAVPVAASMTTETDGTPLATITVKTAGLVAPDDVHPHPAPLLVPLGTDAGGTVVHLNLGRTGGLLVAGGGQALMATLLASTVYQAPPDALRLLVASDDDELRKALPLLDHLEAPPADARDPRAVASIIEQAHTLVLDRYEHHSVPGSPGSKGGMSPVVVPCLIVLAGIEGLDEEALNRLDAVAHTGPACGVHLIATTNDPTSLARVGTLALFRSRLVRRLGPVDNGLVCPDADVSALGPQDVLLWRQGPVRRLRAFSLTPPDVREVFATVAASATGAASATPSAATVSACLPPAPVPPVPAASPAPATASTAPSSPSQGSEVKTETTTTDSAAASKVDTAAGEGMDQDDEDGDADAEAEAVVPVPSTGPLVRLELLGGVAVYVGGQPINILPRERNLLAALAILGPRPVRRGDLIEALFADDDDGGNTLSHTLSDLRAALRRGSVSREQARDIVLRSGAGYHLNGDLVEVDLWQFDTMLREAEDLDEAEAGPALARAFALYHGSLCEGEALDFLEEHGYRWARRVPPALYRLADYYREAGAPKDALHWARRLLADDPCDDHTNQLVMNVLAELGDAEGLDAHVQEMRNHYAADKQKLDPYTLRLYDQLRRKLGDPSQTRAG